jgi:catechol 2,3-dioxygenase-like lactoylglutathione lyase family enzyme
MAASTPGQPVVDVLGVDHLYLAVADLARSEGFYDGVMQTLGFRKGDKPISGEPHAHYFNRVLQLSLRPARGGRVGHDPYVPGLHHLCFQVADRAAVDRACAALRDRGVEATQPKLYPEYNDDYYATFFTDPDGIRLEIVARSKYRKAIAERWDEMRVFLNPLQELLARERSG